ncbi:MAG: deoxyribose-phosphate aldolase [Propionibacteriaceae bacterium]|jgi:deoxyribose-phosphate aldolase|nr:deoxyribose-phosphate aldolase [Propionibacteriaceae bacterium]
MIDLAKMDQWSLGKCFDHSVLPKQTTEADIRAGCREAVKYNCAAFYSASPYWTPVVLEELAGSDVLAGTGIAFPFGVAPSAIKAAETEFAVKAGCRTIDTVLNLGALKDRRYDLVKQELTEFKAAAGPALTKVILDTCFLADDDIKAACELIAEVGCDYAKTATGQFEGPSMDQFLVMKRTLVGTPVKLKVAGVKFPRPQNAYAFLLAGADLIGTRAAIEIINALDSMREIGLVPAREG